MHLRKLSLFVPILITALVSAVDVLTSRSTLTINPNSWYAIYSDDNQFWDSTLHFVRLNHVTGGVSAVNADLGKGMRFSFPYGVFDGSSTTPIRCQEHDDHWVSYNGYVDGDILLHSDSDDMNSNLYVYGYSSDTQLWIGITPTRYATAPQFGSQGLLYYHITEINQGWL